MEAVMASTSPPSFLTERILAEGSKPSHWAMNLASVLHLAPRPGVSECESTEVLYTTPSGVTPTIRDSGPPKPTTVDSTA